MKKLRIFLGAYVNFINAQNINVDNIAKYLDKDKFEVHVCYSTRVPIDKKAYEKENIHLHKMIHHRYIWFWSKWFIMKKGKYDIYYLPKAESVDIRFAKKYKDRYCFLSSFEGVITDKNSEEYERYQFYCKIMDSCFSISGCIAESVKRYWGVDTPVLPLGTVSIDKFLSTKRNIQNVIWVGSFIPRKRPNLFVECAQAFPELMFTMIGTGELEEEVDAQIRKLGIDNIKLLGRVGNEEVYNHLAQNDLILMTSEHEGLPKVIQEAAQCGVPCIYLANNYKVDFIKDGVNGFEAYSLDEMKSKIRFLLEHKDIYREFSEKIKNKAMEFTWPSIIDKYEEYFTNEYLEKVKEK